MMRGGQGGKLVRRQDVFVAVPGFEVSEDCATPDVRAVDVSRPPPHTRAMHPAQFVIRSAFVFAPLQFFREALKEFAMQPA